MGRITGRGIAVTLYDRTQTGTDEFGAPTYAETPVVVENVLVGEPSTQDIIDEINLSGKQLAYTLAIPKGDDHVWTDRTTARLNSSVRRSEQSAIRHRASTS